MQRCFELAEKGLGKVAPNPMVGCVIVKDGKVVGEGFHERFGQNHAEVNALESVDDIADLKGAELYVNLEPCVHHGKTPPCVDKIIESGIGKVIIAGRDPSKKVGGKGVSKLKQNGIEVEEDLHHIGEEILNRRFRTYHEKKRPYIILKWAETQDGYIDIDRSSGEKGQFRISNEESRLRLHKWRSQEQAIMIGTNTALNDNPSLTTRLVEGKNPLRIVLDLNKRLPDDLNLFTDGNRTVVYSKKNGIQSEVVERVILPEEADGHTIRRAGGELGNPGIDFVLKDLYKREIQSLIVEGGKQLLESFLKQNLWDEARIFRSADRLGKGLQSPRLPFDHVAEEAIGDNTFLLYFNREG